MVANFIAHSNSMKKTLLFCILFLCLSLIAIAQPRPGGWPTSQNNVLYEGKYTETGRVYINNTASNQFVISTSFYVKIYSDKLVVTSVPYGQAYASDIEYKYTGNNNGYKIYSLPNGMVFYQVDGNFDIMKVIVAASMMYGANVKDYYYYETVKGEHYQEYNKKHNMDLQSLHDQLYGSNPIGF